MPLHWRANQFYNYHYNCMGNEGSPLLCLVDIFRDTSYEIHTPIQKLPYHNILLMAHSLLIRLEIEHVRLRSRAVVEHVVEGADVVLGDLDRLELAQLAVVVVSGRGGIFSVLVRDIIFNKLLDVGE